MEETSTATQQQSLNAFRNTEAGRLMARLYGHNTATKRSAASQINYPVLTNSKNNRPKRNESTWRNEHQWRAVNSANRLCDPRRSEFDWCKARSVHVPSFRRKLRQGYPSKVDIIPKRKSAQECQGDIQQHAMLREAYRPGNTSGFSTDAEKNRLNEIFTYKGGCALPEDLTNPVESMTPSERMWRENEQKRLDRIKFKRRANGSGMENVQNTVLIDEDKNRSKKNTKDMLFDHIVNEIKERREYQMELEELGAGDGTRRDVATEIASRISRLKQIDAKRANRFISEYYSAHQ